MSFPRSRGHSARRPMLVPSTPVVHLELHTGDLQRAQAFYSQLCDWHPDRVDTRHGSYHTLELGGGLGGGVVECPTTRPLWLPYVEGSAKARPAGAASSSRRRGARSPSGRPSDEAPAQAPVACCLSTSACAAAL